MRPHKFPIYVSYRKAFMEIMWQMDIMDREYFRGQRKASLVNLDVHFAYFSCTSKEGIERFGSLLNNYRLKQDVSRFSDLEVVISAQRKARGLGAKTHQFYFQEDVIRNMSIDEEVNARKDAWRNICAIEERMIKDNPFYVSPYSGIEDKFVKEKLMLGDFSDRSFFEKLKQAKIDAKVAKENHYAQIKSHLAQSSTLGTHIRSRLVNNLL